MNIYLAHDLTSTDLTFIAISFVAGFVAVLVGVMLSLADVPKGGTLVAAGITTIFVPASLAFVQQQYQLIELASVTALWVLFLSGVLHAAGRLVKKHFEFTTAGLPISH